MPEGIYNKQKTIFFVQQFVYMKPFNVLIWNTPEPEPEPRYPVRDEKKGKTQIQEAAQSEISSNEKSCNFRMVHFVYMFYTAATVTATATAIVVNSTQF